MARIRARSEDSASHRPTLPAPNQEETESTGERLLELLGIAHIKSTVAVPQNHWREPETGGGAVVDPVSFIAAAGRREHLELAAPVPIRPSRRRAYPNIIREVD